MVVVLAFCVQIGEGTGSFQVPAGHPALYAAQDARDDIAEKNAGQFRGQNTNGAPEMMLYIHTLKYPYMITDPSHTTITG